MTSLLADESDIGRTAIRRLSLRDPDAALFAYGDRLLRLVPDPQATSLGRLLADSSFVEAMHRGCLVRTWQVPRADVPEAMRRLSGTATVFEHERIQFVTYPQEWSPSMLCEAALLTLKIQSIALAAGYTLKDATPSNIVFRGSRPVFVDWPSLVRRAEGAFLWTARNQFDTCFLLPLLLAIEIGLPLSWTLRDPVRGVGHEAAHRALGMRAWLKPRLLATVVLPAVLSLRSSESHSLERRDSNDARALYALHRQVAALERRLLKLRRAIGARTSRWQKYTESREHYADDDLARKRRFVLRAIAAVRPRRMLDIGANTGEFSVLGLPEATVVALDSDERSVDKLFERARGASGELAAIVGDFSRPTPAEGWDCGESRSLLERLESARFELVLMLAVLHHLRVTAGIPIDRLLDTIARVAQRHVVIELVPPSDPMFRSLERGRSGLYTDCERPSFEQTLPRRFEIEQFEELPNGRVLYLLRKRFDAAA